MPSWFGQGSTGERSAVLLIVLLVLSLACVTLYVREGEDGTIHAVQNVTSGIISPLKSVSGSISVAEESISGRITDATADPNSVVSLREQNEQLRQTVAELEEYRQEALRLGGLLEVKNRYSAQGIPARILSRSPDAWNLVLTIDVGFEDGVSAGLPVMASSGLIGQVVSTTSHTADVRLMQDSKSGIAVIIQSSREAGIVHGSLEGLLYLEDLDDEVDVQAGDVLLTSGLGGGYYRGIMVGTVLKTEGEAGTGSRKIIVEPNASSRPFEEVYVVTSMISPYESEFSDDSGAQGVAGDASYASDGSMSDYGYSNYSDDGQGY